MTPEKELIQKIIRVLTPYSDFVNVPAGEWNRIEAIIKYNKSEWCEEQRCNCVKEIVNEKDKKSQELVEVVRYLILNAPEP